MSLAPDELDFNIFYHTLQSKFRKKYEHALSSCWMICVPCSDAITGIDMTEEFVDIHILRVLPSNPRLYVSANENGSFVYELIEHALYLREAPVTIPQDHVINILSVETGYNKEYQQYKILIIDKPLNPKFKPVPTEEKFLNLNKRVTSLDEATEFLAPLASALHPMQSNFLHLKSSVTPDDLDGTREAVHDTLNACWGTVLRSQPLELQRDRRFQGLLTVALENCIMHQLHDQVFPAVCRRFKDDDDLIISRVRQLAAMGLTADQLGVPEDLAVPLPAAVVELASLDTLACPIDKLTCLCTTLDLLLAELKGVVADACTVQEDLPTLPTDLLIPLLLTVIVQAKPLHLISNLYYVETFQWTVSPSDATSFSLVTFRAAVQQLLSLDPSKLRPRSNRVLRELGMEDLMKVAGLLEDKEHCDSSSSAISPLDRQLERITAMIEASTRELNSQSGGVVGPQSKVALRDLLSSLQNNLGGYFSKQGEQL